MANYANILAEISAAITTNNSQDITGAVLRNVLDDMVAALGAGYQYKGVASPSTNPGTVDQRVFYIAPPGTYTYFGQPTVPNGKLGLLAYDTAWTLSLIDIGVSQLLDDMYGTGDININVNGITSCGGRITAEGKWSTSDNSTYYGGLVDVSSYQGRRYRIVEGNGGSYAFVTAGFSAGQNVAFADGWTAYRTAAANETVEGVIPSDAVYLYVYLQSPGTSYRPQSITILSTDSVLTDVTQLKEDVAELQVEVEAAGKVEVSIDVASITSCGSRIDSNNTWATSSVATYYGGLVPCTAYRGKKYRIVSSGGGSYAFTKAGVSLGDAVEYATGWSTYELMPGVGTEYTGTVPDDAVYLYVYLQSSGTSYRPRSISFLVDIEEALAELEQEIGRSSSPKALSIFEWNIGHFSGGAQKNSTITAAQYVAKVDAFRAILSDERPDIFGILEYSAIFGKNTAGIDVNTKDVLFNFMQTYFESSQMNYACYAMFSGFGVPVYNIQINDFDCLANETITHTTAVTAQDYRYISADLYAFGVTIKLVVTHLAFDSNRPGVLQDAQISELISKYSSSPYVLMLGDWNVESFSEFDAFTVAGYTMANDGSFLTYPGKALDNIVAKGLTIFDAKMITTDLSDHNALLCKILK